MVSNRDDRAAGDRWRSLEVIFYAMLVGQFLFGLVILFLLQEGKPTMVDQLFGEGQDLLILGLYALAMTAGAYFMDQFRSRNIPRRVAAEAERALGHYRTTVILRLAIMEAAIVMLLVVTVLTGNINLLAVAAALMGVFYLFFRPTRQEFRERYDVRLPD